MLLVKFSERVRSQGVKLEQVFLHVGRFPLIVLRHICHSRTSILTEIDSFYAEFHDDDLLMRQ